MQTTRLFLLVGIVVLSLIVVKDIYVFSEEQKEDENLLAAAAIANKKMAEQQQQLLDLSTLQKDLMHCRAETESNLRVRQEAVGELAELRNLKSVVKEYVHLANNVKADFAEIDFLTKQWNSYDLESDAAKIDELEMIYKRLLQEISRYEKDMKAHDNFVKINQKVLQELQLQIVPKEQMDGAFSLYKKNAQTFKDFLDGYEPGR